MTASRSCCRATITVEIIAAAMIKLPQSSNRVALTETSEVDPS